MTTISSDIHGRLDALEADAAKGRLLTKYAEREPKEFIQYDAFQPEVNNDSLFSVHTVGPVEASVTEQRLELARHRRTPRLRSARTCETRTARLHTESVPLA